MFQPNSTGRRSRKAFTLVELLVVIGIISVLVAILLPSLNKAREAAKNVQCMSNMRQLGVALRMYAHDYDGWLPSPTRTQSQDSTGGTGSNWYYLTNVVGPMYLGFKPTMGNGGVFRCPDDTAWTMRLPTNSYYTDYGVNSFVSGGTLGSLPCPSGKLVELRQPARTALMLETYCHAVAVVYQGPPADVTVRSTHVVVRHDGRGNVLFVDGHVESRYAKEMPIQEGYPGASAVSMVNTVFAHGLDPDHRWTPVGNF